MDVNECKGECSGMNLGMNKHGRRNMWCRGQNAPHRKNSKEKNKLSQKVFSL